MHCPSCQTRTRLSADTHRKGLSSAKPHDPHGAFFGFRPIGRAKILWVCCAGLGNAAKVNILWHDDVYAAAHRAAAIAAAAACAASF